VTADWVPLPEFVRVAEIPESSIERFKDLVPEEIADLWRAGAGIAGDGFLRVIDPAEFVDVVHEGLAGSETTVPIAVTAFGDLVCWRDNLMLAVLFRYGTTEGLSKKPATLGTRLVKPDWATVMLKAPLWEAARDTLGVPDFDECFGFVPMLVLGGAEKVENLKRVKLKEHLDLLVQATGPIV
jgi:hypothetical protein